MLRQWLGELSTRGYLHRDARGYRTAAEPSKPERPDLVAVCADLGYPAPFGRFLHNCNTHLDELVGDRMSVQELLFPDGSTDTADAFYRDNAISRYLNDQARTAVTDSRAG